MEIGFREVRDIVQEVLQPSVDDSFANLATAKIGDGTASFHADRSGIWLGATSFHDAPFSVDMEGNVTLNSILAIPGYSTTEDINTSIAFVQGQVTTQAATISGQTTSIASLTTRATDVEIEIGRQGGSNLIKNSVGLKGTTIDEWGTAVTVDRSDDTVNNTESHCGLYLDNKSITQTIPTITGQYYMFYCRFKKNVTTNITISGVDGVLAITSDGYSSGTWSTYTKDFTASSEATIITIYNASGYAVISDTICKKGVVTGWQQAPNEVYGQGFKFDIDGLRVTDSASTFYSQLDENGLTVVDTSIPASPVTAMQVDKDSGKINNLIAQTNLTVQRYENSTKGLQIIPTTTGAMFVIND